VSESALLGDVKMAYLEPMDNGTKAVLVFQLEKPIEINGRHHTSAGCILDEKRIMEIVDGLHSVANMREAAKEAERIIKIQ
jgi:hypothetical protein